MPIWLLEHFISLAFALLVFMAFTRKRVDKPFILQLSIKQWLFVGAIVGLFYTIIAKLLLTFTHSKVAVLDALTTALSLVAQGLMCYRAIAT